MRTHSFLIVIQFLLLANLSFAQGASPQSAAAWQAPAIERTTSIRRGRTGEFITWRQMMKELGGVDAVFLGETHVDETTHRVELEIYDRLLTKRPGKVVLSMEMFERDQQAGLNRYLSGEQTEAEFLSSTRPWANYQTAYRPMVERAKKAKAPVIAANFPRSMRRLVARGGLAAFDKLEGDQKKLVPAEIKANTKAYWRRVDNAVRGHLAMMKPRAGDDLRLMSTQTLWDNAMGESCALALKDHPGHMVVHVNGGFHTAYWSGTARQFQLRSPESKTLTVDIRPAMNPVSAKLDGAPTADYVIFAEARARDLNDGKWAIQAGREVPYLLHMPKDIPVGQKVPLLIWFSDNGLSAQDGMKLWKSRLESEAAIAVVESPYPAVQFDMGPGGRWFWPETFSADVGAMNLVLERIWAYVCRYYEVDPARLVVAGEGTGATIAASSAILSSRMDAKALAFFPKQYVKIKDFPLPLPELRGDSPQVSKSLTMVLNQDDEEWWKPELAQYQKIGITSRVMKATMDPWLIEANHLALVRESLGLTSPEAESKPRRHIVVEKENPRAIYWARVKAASTTNAHVAVLTKSEAQATKNSTAIPIAYVARAFARPFALPRCPGPFGGTTVIVLPPNISEIEREEWAALVDDDPITKVSRFHRLRVAFGDDLEDLVDVLKELQDEGRKNILMVPVEFCASPATMQKLARAVRGLENQMTIHWLPGLGGR